MMATLSSIEGMSERMIERMLKNSLLQFTVRS
jgi:hypothetical protein